MGTLVQLINAGHKQKGKTFKRWMCFGNAIIVGRGLTLKVFREDIDGEDVIMLTLFKNNRLLTEGAMYSGKQMDASKSCGFRIVPRALEIREDGRGSRVFLEFVPTNPATTRAVERLA